MKDGKQQLLFEIAHLPGSHAGWEGPYSAYLWTQEDKEPWIRLVRTADGYVMNEFRLAAMFAPTPLPHEVHQYHGDGPMHSTVSIPTVWRAVQEAMSCLTPQDGRFEVVWVPNDPAMPF